jgi:hypothetical protein
MQIRRKPLVLIPALIGIITIPAAAAFEGDLVPRLADGRIVNDGISDEDGSTSPNVNVFQYSLGELSPGFTQDPGLQPQTGGGLPGGSYLGFNVAGPLLYWDGNNTPAFSPAPSAALELSLGTLRVAVSGATASQNGFVVQQLTAQGAGHRHLNAQLVGTASPIGTYRDSTGATYLAPADGVYAFPIIVTDSFTQTTSPATYSSASTWVVYGQNVSNAVLTEGANALPPAATPEPSTLLVLALGTFTLLGVRRRT